MEEKDIVKIAEVQEKQAISANVEIKADETPYKVYGYDIFVKDPIVKEYYKATNKIMSVVNLLVGEIDDKGNYIIPKEIKRDLVVMDKEIEDFGDNYFKATNVYMKKHFYFNIHMSLLKDGRAKAALYLSEFVGEFKEEEYIVSHVADYVDTYDTLFRSKVRKAFNLVEVDVPNNDLLTPNLAILMQGLLDERLIAEELYEMACQIYVMRLLSELEASGELGKSIVEEYKQIISLFGDEKISNIRLKAILDRIINKRGGYERIRDLVDTKSLFAEITQTLLNIKNRRSAVEVKSEDKKEEKKEDAKAAGGKKVAGKKPAAKKAGGGGGKKAGKKGGAKKPAAKKDDKKKRVTGNLSYADYQRALNAGTEDPKKETTPKAEEPKKSVVVQNPINNKPVVQKGNANGPQSTETDNDLSDVEREEDLLAKILSPNTNTELVGGKGKYGEIDVNANESVDVELKVKQGNGKNNEKIKDPNVKKGAEVQGRVNTKNDGKQNNIMVPNAAGQQDGEQNNIKPNAAGQQNDGQVKVNTDQNKQRNEVQVTVSAEQRDDLEMGG